MLDFSDKTFREYFDDEFGIDIDDRKYSANGSSKMNRLRTFFRFEDGPLVASVFRSLWTHRQALFAEGSGDPAVEARLFELLARIEGGGEVARTDAIDLFTPDETLEELVAAIERDILADRPSAALDRLHSYCAKKFGHLLDQRGISWDRGEPLQSRVGKYAKSVHSRAGIERDDPADFEELNWGFRQVQPYPQQSEPCPRQRPFGKGGGAIYL